MDNELKKVLQDCIVNVGNEFQPNELAFLAIQGKIELQLRDKIAWLLYSKGYKNVKKEYAPRNAEDIGRKKCDLAILDDNLNPMCLVEFKAHSSVKWVSRSQTWFEEDLDKMRLMVEKGDLKDVELFYVFFQTEHTKIFKSDREITLVPYYEVINRGVTNEKRSFEEQWKEMCSSEDNSQDLITSCEISAGTYLDDTVKIHAMIFGPTK